MSRHKVLSPHTSPRSNKTFFTGTQPSVVHRLEMQFVEIHKVKNVFHCFPELIRLFMVGFIPTVVNMYGFLLFAVHVSSLDQIMKHNSSIEVTLDQACTLNLNEDENSGGKMMHNSSLSESGPTADLYEMYSP